jgi:hypothetical protein
MEKRTRKRKYVNVNRKELLDFHFIRVPETNVAQKVSFLFSLGNMFDSNPITLLWMHFFQKM